MTTVQEPLTNAIPPFPFFIENPAELNRTELPANKANNNQFASDDQVVERQKGVSPRESHGDQELSRVTKSRPPLAHEKVHIDTNQLPDRCQFSFSDGRQCAMARSDIHPSLCRFHSEREDQLFGDPAPGGNVVGAALDLPELHSACRDLTTAAGVNRALAQVFRLLAQRRISRQEAATFGHLAQLLLRTISAMRADPTRIGVPSEHREPRDLSFSSPRREANAAPASCPEADDAASPPRKGYPPAAKVYQQDELSPPNKGALFAGNKVIPSLPSADERVAVPGVSYDQRVQTVQPSQNEHLRKTRQQPK